MPSPYLFLLSTTLNKYVYYIALCISFSIALLLENTLQWPHVCETGRTTFISCMMTSSSGNIFRVNGLLCGGIHRSPVNSPHKSQWRGALIFSLICAWINGWVNNREAGDLRRHRAHHEVIVMNRTGNVYLMTSKTPQASISTFSIVWDIWVQCLSHCLSCHYNIEVETKWSPVCRRHFKIHFLQRKCILNHISLKYALAGLLAINQHWFK